MFVTKNLALKSLLLEVEVIRNSICPVLITGESGTGKEILADYIHENSSRSNKRFVKVSISSLPESLIESELFGHEKGSYTGANSKQIGFFEAAKGATIYLDDIDDLPVHLQSKILRVIENKEIIRIGSNEPIRCDVRLITSTKVELSKLFEKGKFRSDLFYRLNVFNFYIPPLRERKNDIPILVDYFIDQYSSPDKPKLKIKNSNLQPLMDYDWKGNVRELQNFIQKISLYPTDYIYENFEAIFEKHINYTNNSSQPLNTQNVQSLKPDESEDSLEKMVDDYEKGLILKALEKSFGNVNLASRLLNIKSPTLRSKIKKYLIKTKK